MKVRNGFVSNSSSSSFILALERLPQSSDEVNEMIFRPSEGGLGHIEKAQIIFRDILEAEQLDDDALFEAFCGGFVYGDPKRNWSNYHETTREERRKQFEEFLERVRVYRKQVMEKFKEQNPNAKIFVSLEYGDDTSLGSELEHNTPWEDLPWVFRISNH